MEKNNNEISEAAKGLCAGIADRAIWFHLLIDAAQKQNADIEKLTDDAIFTYGRNLYKNEKAENARDFIELMTKEGPGKESFEQEIIRNEEHHSVALFHRCPLVDAWKDYGLSSERIKYLCDLACKGDFGRVSNFANVEIEFPNKIGNGDKYCELVAKSK